MAQTVINLSDPISTWVSKSNTIGANIGDLATLNDSAATLVHAINSIDSDLGDRTALNTAAPDLVSAINNIGLGFRPLTDSADIKNLFASTTGIGGITYNSGSAGVGGTFTLVNDAIDETKIVDNAINEEHFATNAVSTRAITPNAITSAELANSSVSNAKIQSGAVTSTNLASLQTLLIKNSAGTTLKTMYGPGV
jgi:hypothetical protein